MIIKGCIAFLRYTLEFIFWFIYTYFIDTSLAISQRQIALKFWHQIKESCTMKYYTEQNLYLIKVLFWKWMVSRKQWLSKNCLLNKNKCIKRTILLITTDYVEGNKKMFLNLNEDQEYKTTDPFVNCTCTAQPLGKSLKTSFSN